MNTSLYVTLVQAARAQKDHQDRVEGGAGVVAHRRSGRQGWKVLRKLLKPLMKQSPRMNRGQPLPPGVGLPLAPARSRGPPTCQVIHASLGLVSPAINTPGRTSWIGRRDRSIFRQRRTIRPDLGSEALWRRGFNFFESGTAQRRTPAIRYQLRPGAPGTRDPSETRTIKAAPRGWSFSIGSFPVRERECPGRLLRPTSLWVSEFPDRRVCGVCGCLNSPDEFVGA
jgi:hypothetical protein